MSNDKKPIRRVWCDGCFDVVHFGHANALRQAKSLGDYLVVGVHNDEEISKHKGPPVFTQKERFKMLEAIKWVDEVIEDAPYTTTIETLNKYNCDFCTHGEDISIGVDGVDIYHLVKKSGRYKEISRTAGISTTNLVGRMLRIAKSHLNQGDKESDKVTSSSTTQLDTPSHSPYTGSKFLPTFQKIAQFSNEKEPESTDRIIYVAGAFDLFHIGHLDFLKRARAEGDYLIVGLHSDSEVNRYKGSNYPIMNVYERAFSLMACKYVSDVVIGAPYSVTIDLMEQFRIDLVCHGMAEMDLDKDTLDHPYALPIQLGKFKLIDSENTMSTENIIERIVSNRLQFEARNSSKERKEIELIKKLELNESNSVHQEQDR